jgi:hypothetical protein
MAEVRKQDPGESGGGAPPNPGSGPATPQAPQPPRHNLPMKTAPVVGRKAEMHAIATAFEKARREGRPGRVEVVGRPGIGATTVAVELARRAGSRFPGGAWVLDVAMGADLAWADLAAVRGKPRTKNLATLVREEKERVAEGPPAIFVLDGVRSADDLLAASPLESRQPPYVFAVAETRTGLTDDVVTVSEVPPQGALRICKTILHATKDAAAPPVRCLDGQGLTASVGARAAMALQGRAGPLLFEDLRSAITHLVPLISRAPVALELLLMTSVLHPSRICVDALFGAVAEVRKGRGAAPEPREVGEAVLMLARAGLAQPDDERRISVHPLVQEVVRGMAQSAADLDLARTSVAAGLCQEAEHAMEGEDGVDVAAAGLHQLRFVEGALAAGEAKEKVASVRAKLERSLGIAA